MRRLPARAPAARVAGRGAAAPLRRVQLRRVRERTGGAGDAQGAIPGVLRRHRSSSSGKLRRLVCGGVAGAAMTYTAAARARSRDGRGCSANRARRASTLQHPTRRRAAGAPAKVGGSRDEPQGPFEGPSKGPSVVLRGRCDALAFAPFSCILAGFLRDALCDISMSAGESPACRAADWRPCGGVRSRVRWLAWCAVWLTRVPAARCGSAGGALATCRACAGCRSRIVSSLVVAAWWRLRRWLRPPLRRWRCRRLAGGVAPSRRRCRVGVPADGVNGRARRRGRVGRVRWWAMTGRPSQDPGRSSRSSPCSWSSRLLVALRARLSGCCSSACAGSAGR